MIMTVPLFVSSYSVTSVIYKGNIGDYLPWHEHYFPHGHCIIKGKTLVEIEGQSSFEMKAGDENIEIPSHIKHQITILEPDTIFINMQPVVPNESSLIGATAPSGGVTLV